MSLSLVRRDGPLGFYASLAARCGAPVLMLGAADGVLASALAGRGHPVVAVEPSPMLLAEGKRRTALAPVQWVQADVRAVRLHQQFPLVVAPRNALSMAGVGTDLDAALATVRRHLTPKGSFAFDLERTSSPLNVEGPLGRKLFSAHLRERKEGSIRRLKRHGLSLDELEAALSAAGLEATERYGDFQGRPWDEGDELQVVVASLR